MNILDILKNDILIVAMLSWFIAQMAKVVINAIINKSLSFERLFGDGGMPSGHSATITAAALMIGITEGFTSSLFGLACVVAIVVMHDATGVRYQTGKHASTIMEITSLVNEYMDYIKESDKKIRSEKLKTLVGHTKLQVFFGALTGIAVALVYTYFFEIPFVKL